jgi:hypothetical protein
MNVNHLYFLFEENMIKSLNPQMPQTHIARSNEILGWEGVGNRQLLCFFEA